MATTKSYLCSDPYRLDLRRQAHAIGIAQMVQHSEISCTPHDRSSV